jgi:hypothetical protein
VRRPKCVECGFSARVTNRRGYPLSVGRGASELTAAASAVPAASAEFVAPNRFKSQEGRSSTALVEVLRWQCVRQVE